MRLRPVLAGVAVAIGLAAPAHADPAGIDASFVAALDKAGITYSSADQAIAAGRQVCAMIDNGQPDLDVIKKVTDENPGVTISGAAKFAAIAMSAYCPQHLPKASGSGGASGST